MNFGQSIKIFGFTIMLLKKENVRCNERWMWKQCFKMHIIILTLPFHWPKHDQILCSWHKLRQFEHLVHKQPRIFSWFHWDIKMPWIFENPEMKFHCIFLVSVLMSIAMYVISVPSTYIIGNAHVNKAIFADIVKKIRPLRICEFVIIWWYFCQNFRCDLFKVSNACSMFRQYNCPTGHHAIQNWHIGIYNKKVYI